MAVKKERKTMPMNALGPVSRMGDRARLEQRATGEARAAAKTRTPTTGPSKPPKPVTRRPGGVAAAGRQMATMRAPTPAAVPNRAGASFTPGSKADMAYTGVRTASKAVPKRVPKMGGGVAGAALTAAAGAGMAAYDKFRNRDRKRTK